MPIYEYLCQECGHELEAMQKVSDPLLVDCPACQRASLKKKLTASAFRLSGGGWYETDFKTGDKKRNLAADGEAKSTSGSDGSGSVKPAGDSGSAAAKSDSATAAS